MKSVKEDGNVCYKGITLRRLSSTEDNIEICTDHSFYREPAGEDEGLLVHHITKNTHPAK